MVNFKSEKFLTNLLIVLSIYVLNIIFKTSHDTILLQIFIFVVFSLTIFLFNRDLFASYILCNVFISIGIQSSFIGNNPNYLFLVLSILVLIVMLFYDFRFNTIKNLLPLNLYIFIIYYFLVNTLLISTNAQTEYYVLHFKMLLLSIFVAYQFRNKLSVKLFENTILYSSVIVSIHTLLLFIFGYDIGISDRSDFIDIIPDRNYLSHMLSYGFIIGLNRIINVYDKKLFYIIFLIIIILAQIETASRGGLIATLASSLLILYYQKNIKNKLKYILILFLFSLFLLPLFINSVLFTRFEDNESLITVSSRSFIWEKTLDEFWNQDILYKLFGGGYFHGVQNLNSGISIHNNFFEILFDLGFIGLGLFLYIFYKSYKKSDLIKRSLIAVTFVECFSLTPWMNIFFWLKLVYFSINTKFLNAKEF
jgi:hypothetical protein